MAIEEEKKPWDSSGTKDSMQKNVTKTTNSGVTRNNHKKNC